VYMFLLYASSSIQSVPLEHDYHKDPLVILMLKVAEKTSNFLSVLSLITMIIIWQMMLLNRKWIY
jgi:hypothetical protein